MSGLRSLAALLVRVPSRARATFYRATAPLFLRRVGPNCRFFGSVHLARPLSNILIGANTMIGHGVFWQVAQGARFRIGDNSSINSNSTMVAAASIEIGNNVAIAELVSIRDQEHRFSPQHGVVDQGYVTAPIIIEDNVWIGRGVYIGPGSHIRSGTIVGANSVVRGAFPPNVLIAGAPAVIKKELA